MTPDFNVVFGLIVGIVMGFITGYAVCEAIHNQKEVKNHERRLER